MSFLSPLTPRLKTFKNTWFSHKQSRFNKALRLLFLAAIGIVLPLLIFQSVFATLLEFTLQNVSIALILDMVLFSVVSILFFSNAVHALHILFFAKDSQLLITSPISNLSLFTAKFIEVLLSASWVIFLFFIPAMCAIGAAVGAQASYYFILLLSLPGLFTLPTAFGYTIALLLVRFYPRERVKEMLVIGSVLLVILLHFFLSGKQAIVDMQHIVPRKLLTQKPLSIDSVSLFLAYPYLVSIPGKMWDALSAIGVLSIVSCLSIFGAYRIFKELYISLEPGASHQFLSRTYAFKNVMLFPKFVSPTLRAIAMKEYKIFARDLAQPVQLVLFLTLSAIGLYGIKTSAVFAQSKIQGLPWWYDFLVVVILTFEIFLAVLFCGRFVYPSASLEAEATWLLRSAPINLKEIIRARTHAYQAPILLIFSALTLCAGYLVSLPLSFIGYGLVLTLLNTAPVVSYAIIFGTLFTDPDHQHVAQIVSGFGNFIYMVTTLAVMGVINFFALCSAVIPEVIGWPYPRELGYGLCCITLLGLHYLLKNFCERATIKLREA